MLQKLKTRLKKQAFVRRLVLWSHKIRPIGFGGLSFYELFSFLSESFAKADYATRGAAIAFNVFLALFPLLILGLSLIPFVPIPNFQDTILNEIYGWIPDSMHHFVQVTIDDLVLQKHSYMLSLGFILTLFYASSSINAILNSFNRSYQVSINRNPIKQRLISLGLLFLISLIFMVGATLVIVGDWLIISLFKNGNINELVWYLAQGLKWLIMLFAILISISILYNFGNPDHKSYRLTSPGAMLATIIILLASIAFSFFVSNFGSYNQLYGSLSSLIVLLLWLYLSSRILLIGFELTTKTDQYKINLKHQLKHIT